MMYIYYYYTIKYKIITQISSIHVYKIVFIYLYKYCIARNFREAKFYSIFVLVK